MSILPKKHRMNELCMVNIIRKWFEEPNLLYGFLTKYHGSLNNPSRAKGDFHTNGDCDNSGETEEVHGFKLYETNFIFGQLFLLLHSFYYIATKAAHASAVSF